jgi:hypothetical protein
MRYPLIGKTETLVKNSEPFLQLLQSINVGGSDILVTFDIVSLFTKDPVEKALEIIRNNRWKMTHWQNIEFWRWMPSWCYWRCV